MALLDYMRGKISLPIYFGDSSFSEFNDAQPIISRLNKQGYETAFLTPGILNFTNKDKLYKALDFQYYEGAEGSFYDDMQRLYKFYSAPDSALYARTLSLIDPDFKLENSLFYDHIPFPDHIDAQHKKNFMIMDDTAKEIIHDFLPSKSLPKSFDTPYFIVLETISSHLPFLDPMSGKEKNFAHAMRYSDSMLGLFIEDLKKRSFFDNGIVLITSDHRRMGETLSQLEIDTLGSALEAQYRVPMVVIAPKLNLPNIIEGPYDHGDIMSSVSSVIGPEFCLDLTQNSFLKPQSKDRITFISQTQNGLQKVHAIWEDQQAEMSLLYRRSTIRQSGLDKRNTQRFFDYMTHQSILNQERQDNR